VSRFVLLPGQRHDSVGVEPLIAGVKFGALLGDKAFDNDALRATLKERGAVAVIPAKSDRRTRIPHDVEMYKWRHLVDIDQAWRLSRFCGGVGGVIGGPRRQAAPGRRCGADRLQRRDRLGIGAHEHGALRAEAGFTVG